MKFDQLEALFQVYNTGSTIKAAAKMYTTPQNISKLIKQLESEMASKLVNVSNHGTELTENGVKVALAAQETLQKFARLKEEFAFKQNIVGEIQIISARIPNICYLYKAVSDFTLKYPEIKIKLKEANVYDVFETCALDSSYLGFAPRFTDKALDEEFYFYQHELISEPINSDKMMIIVKKGSNLAKKKHLSLKELENQHIAITTSNSDPQGSFFAQLIKKYISKENIEFSTSSYDLYYQCIADGHYIGSSTERTYINSTNSYFKAHTVAVDIEENTNFCNHVCYAKNKIITPAEELFLKYVQENVDAN